MLPPLLHRKRRRELRLRCPPHLAWVRKHACCVPGCFGTDIEAAHVRQGTDGGIGLKPGDEWVISLCRHDHQLQHRHGEDWLEQTFRIDMKALAREFAAASPALRRMRAKEQRK